MKTILMVAVLTLVSACQPFSEPQSMLDEYVERAARVLEQNHELHSIPSLETFPRRRNRRLEPPSLDMGMLDFLSLYGCELQLVVGERNSGLGRVMQPINVLRYEVRFIEAAGDCLPEIEDDDDLKEKIAKARESKIESLPVATWNATWGTEAIESVFTLTRGLLPVGSVRDATGVLETDLNLLLSRLDRLEDGRWDTDLSFLGRLQKNWDQSHQMGQLLKSARALVTRLNEAASLAEARLEGRPLCLNGRTNNQADTVQAMFMSVYAGEIQPYLARVERLRETLLPAFAELGGRHRQVMPEAFEEYYNRYLQQSGEGNLWRALDQATRRHTEAWQSLLEQCGLRPGQNRG